MPWVDSLASRWIGWVIFGCSGAVFAQAPSLLTPVDRLAGNGLPGAPWTVEKLPEQQFSTTGFRIVRIDDRDAMRIEANASYGNLVHPLNQRVRDGAVLSWQWRVDELNLAADLRNKQADDTSAKVCVLFEMALDQVPFIERQIMRIARSRSGRELPAASICYVWDARLPVGTSIDNAYSRRVRYLVLRSGVSAQRRWLVERRDVAADFRLLFGAESPAAVPPVQAIAIGADADNTGARSLAFVADLRLDP